MAPSKAAIPADPIPTPDRIKLLKDVIYVGFQAVAATQSEAVSACVSVLTDIFVNHLEKGDLLTPPVMREIGSGFVLLADESAETVRAVSGKLFSAIVGGQVH